MAVIQTYLDNAIKSNISYGNLNIDMKNNPDKYMYELTRTDSKGEIKMSIEEAKLHQITPNYTKLHQITPQGLNLHF